MTWYRNLRMGSKIILPVAAVLIVALSILSWQIQSRSSEVLASIAGRELAAAAGLHGATVKNFLDTPLSQSQALALATSKVLESHESLTRPLFLTMLQGLLSANPTYLGVGAAFEPGTFDNNDAASANTPGSDASGRFIPYFVTNSDVTLLEEVDTSAYYAESKKRNRAFLTEPFLYPIDNKDVLMATVSSPVNVHGKFVGAVMIDMQAETLNKLIEAIRLYKTGKGVLLSNTGTIISHTNTELVGKNVFDLSLVKDVSGLRNAMSSGRPFMEQHAQSRDLLQFYYYSPVHFGQTGQTWYLGVSAPWDEVMAEAVSLSHITMGMCLIILLLTLLIIFIVVRSAVRPLGEITAATQQIAEGKYTVQVDDSRYGGEVKSLTLSIRTMIRSLVTTIAKAEELAHDAKAQTEKAQIAMQEADALRIEAENAKREGMLQAAHRLEGVVNIISSASEQLAAQVAQSEQGSQEQAARVGETATAMEEMNATVLEVARNAGVAAEGSNSARAKAQSGSTIVKRSIDALDLVGKSASAMNTEVQELGRQAESIGAIMTVISDIADQTNLLALNAAIEAARAGEAGRGFAVVADEVRKLAEKTMTATKEVGSAISGIQQGTQRSIAAMSEAAKNVESATALAVESGEALTEIVTESEHTADQVRNIAAAAEQQSATSDEINHSINKINEISMQTAQAMQEAAQAVSDLAGQTQELSKLIEEMKNA